MQLLTRCKWNNSAPLNAINKINVHMLISCRSYQHMAGVGKRERRDAWGEEREQNDLARVSCLALTSARLANRWRLFCRLFLDHVLANLSLPDMRMESHSTDDKAIENFRFKDDGKVIVIHVEQGSKMQKNVSPWASEWRWVFCRVASCHDNPCRHDGTALKSNSTDLI